jgi:predicted nucleic acid-binding protein
MIILDTDILSAVMRQDQPVIKWLNSQSLDDLNITAITLFEVRSGIERLDAGHKRSTLELALERAVVEIFDHRVLPFDEISARAASDLFGTRRRAGIVTGTADTQIAGIALVRNATLATHNTRHFSDANIPLIDPWKAS